MKVRKFEGIDYLKGFLTILVIIGHIQVKRLDEDVIRYAIYSFHMPLFLAISGFLIKKEGFRKLSIKGMVDKYFYRMIVPWCIAWVPYFIYLNREEVFKGNITIKLVIKNMLFPPYHLWYIYSLFLMLIFLWITLKFEDSYTHKGNSNSYVIPMTIILVSFAFSMVWQCIYTFDPKRGGPVILGNKKTFYYFCYFYLGYYIRNYKTLIIPKGINLILVILFSVIRIFDFYYIDNIYFTQASFIVLNIVIIFYCLNYVSVKSFDRMKFSDTIKNIGRMSLPIYLWHEGVVLFLKHYLYSRINLNVYYGIVGTITFFNFIPLIFILSRNKFINEYIFGAKR